MKKNTHSQEMFTKLISQKSKELVYYDWTEAKKLN